MGRYYRSAHRPLKRHYHSEPSTYTINSMSDGLKWIRIAFIALACFGMLAAAAYTIAGLHEALDQISRLEGQIADLSHQKDGAGSSNLDEAIARLRAQGEELDERIDVLTLKMRATSRRLDSVEAGDLDDLGIDDLVDQKLSEHLTERRKSLTAARRPSVERLGEYLTLTTGQEHRVAQVIDRAKDDVWEVLNTRREDGQTLMEGVVETLKTPLAPEVKKERLLSQLFNQGPPGSEDSYFTTIMEIRAGALDDFYTILDDGQDTKFKTMGIDPFAIQTGYSPFRDEFWKTVMSGQ